jgi:hypothetical protein
MHPNDRKILFEKKLKEVELNKKFYEKYGNSIG